MDNTSQAKSAELLVAPPRSERGLRNILHTLPKGRGAVFGLIDIDSRDESGRERLLHIAASHLEHLAHDLEGDVNPPRRFEQMLSELNQSMLEVAQDAGLKADKLNGAVGLLTQNQIFISGIGKISALFLHKTAQRRYSIYELDAQFNEGRAPEENRFFLTILDGEIHPGDVFYVATPLKAQAIGSDELHDILVTLPPAGALQRIRQFVPAGEHYAAIGFAFKEDDRGLMKPPKKSNPIGSLEELQGSQENTKTVLGESNAELSNLVKSVAQSVSKRLSSPGTRGASAILKRAASIVFQVAAKTFTIIVLALSKILSLLKLFFSNIFLGSSKKNISHKSAPRVSPQKKLMLVGVLALILIGSGLLFLTKKNSAKTQGELNFNNTVSLVEKDILAAEASLIYRNNDEAHKTLVEAENILQTLPGDTAAHIAQLETLTRKIAVLQDKIRGIVTVEPQTIATLDSTMSPITAATNTNGRIYAFAGNLDIYRLDTLGSVWIKEGNTKGLLETISSATGENDNVVVVDQNKQLGRADMTGKTLNPIAGGTTNMLSVEDIAAYGGNLYALSAQAEQILKMRPQGASYEAGTSWIVSKNSELTGARALAIDGDVFVLTANGIVRFRSGREQIWEHADIDPALSNPTDIWTDTTTKYLYILDPGASRIIIMNKDTGAVEAQYTAPELKGAVSFMADEAQKRLLFITRQTAYAFTIDLLVK